MFALKACTVCLKTDVKVFSLNIGQLRHEYNLVSGLMTHSKNGLPEYLCYQCVGYVKNFIRFRDKCQRTYYALQEILDRDKKITQSIIEELDSNVLNIEPTISYLAADHIRTKYENVKHKNVKQNYVDLKQQENITVVQYGTTSDDLIFEVPKKKPKLWIDLEDNIKQEEDRIVKNFESFRTESPDLDTKPNDDSFFDSNFDDCDEPQLIIDNDDKLNIQADVSGVNLEEEYATMLPISVKEAKAVVDVYKLLAQGKFSCKVCGKTYNSECRLKAHMRMHEMSINGTFFCALCKYYYRSELLLKSHMTEKHMYKYLCKKCPEVNFDRHSAKRHYYWGHFQEISNKGSNWSRSTKVTKGGRKNKSAIRRLGTKQEVPHDFPIQSAVSQAEQYALVRDRQKTKNYIDSPFKCEYCFKGFRVVTTFETHLKKHDPALSGKLQCDACKICYPSTGKMYKHMTRCHIFKYSCQMCGYTCFNRGQAKVHYRWHKKVTYPCPHCKKEFSKESTKLGHIRKMHPSTNICNICGHSFVSVTGLHIHKLKTHSKEEIEENDGKVDTSNPLYCAECGVQFRDEDAFTTHLGSSNKHADTNRAITKLGAEGEGEGARLTDKGVVNMGRATSSHCDICNKYLLNDTQAVRHYDAEHPGAPYLKRYMCDICGHKTRQYANLVVHMRTHTQEKPYSCPHCDRRFSMQNNRDRHLVVHTGEKKYQCPHCNRRFSQKNTVKLHVQTVHLKIPYPPWNKKNRKRRREPSPPSPAPYKLPLDSHGNYLSAYIDTTNKVCGANYAITKLGAEGEGEGARLTDKGVVNMGRATSSHCDICNKYLLNDTQAVRHYDAEHPGAPYLKRYMCDICGHKTRQYANLVVHMRTHTQEKPYSCPHCDRRFSMQNNRDRHLVVHTGEKKYQCPHCNRRFSQKNTVKLHVQTVHLKIPYPPWNKKNRKRRREPSPPSPAPYKLPLDSHGNYLSAYIDTTNKVCGANYAITKLGAEGEGEGARLTDKGVVNMGRATSSHCDICNKYLLNDTQAVRHYDAEHPGAPYLKRYMCDICGHKTRQYANLVVHMRTHTQEKPYSCPHCDRRFSMQNNRDRHLVVHTGEKKYQCPHCNRRFSQKNTVKLHVQTVHLKIPYPPWNKKNRKRRREPSPPSPAPYKLPLDSHGNYLSAYIDTTNKVCGAN